MKRVLAQEEEDAPQGGTAPKAPRVEVDIPYVCSSCTSGAIALVTMEILRCMFVQIFLKILSKPHSKMPTEPTVYSL